MGDPGNARAVDTQRLRIERSDPSGKGQITLRYDGEVLASFPDERSFDKDDGTFSGLPETVLVERARIIALARSMTDDRPPKLYPTERHVAPDGRTMLELHIGFDPRDIHQQREQRAPRVFDALTGVTTLDLLRIDRDWHFAWDADGALRLASDDLTVRIALAEGVFATSADAWQPHPIAEAQSTLMRLLAARRDDSDHDGRVRRVTLLDRMLWPVVAGVFALAGGAIYAGAFPGFGRMVAGGGSVDSWIVQCPGTALPVILHRTVQNTLEVPREMAPSPLAALKGSNRYGDGSVVVEIEGMGARIWPNGPGGKALECRGPDVR